MRIRTALMLLAWVALLLVQESQVASGNPAPQEPELRQELLAMSAEDQRVRREMLSELGEQGFTFGSAESFGNLKVLFIMLREGWKQSQLGRKNRGRLEEIVETHGWPGKTLVGEDGASAAWLLVQHSDADVAFQKRCLALMEAVPKEEVSAKNLAYLTDRVLVAEQKMQRYGTQMGANFEVRPIEDAEHVDARRAEIGLPPLADYVADAKKQRGVSTKKVIASSEIRPESSAKMAGLSTARGGGGGGRACRAVAAGPVWGARLAGRRPWRRRLGRAPLAAGRPARP